MKLNSKLLGIIVLAVIFGGISLSSALGYWNTEGSGGSHGNGTVSVSGQPEEESIRGRTTFQDLLAMGLPQETIEHVIGGPMPDPLTRVKDYCAANGLDFETIREALQAELNQLDG
jgi:hypothetical protein